MHEVKLKRKDVTSHRNMSHCKYIDLFFSRMFSSFFHCSLTAKAAQKLFIEVILKNLVSRRLIF